MIDANTIVSEVKEEFEGGVSIPVNWNSIVKRAVRKILKETKPKNLKRTVPIYGGLVGNLYVYHCPSDILAPSDIYSNDGNRKYSYMPPRAFYASQDLNKYTIDTINNARVLIVKHTEVSGTLLVDAMDSVGTKTGGSPQLDTHNFLFGSGAIKISLQDSGVEFGDDTELDISEYTSGVFVAPTYIPDATKLASLEWRFKTTNDDYIKLLSSSGNIADYLANGWNNIVFSMDNRVTVGAPDLANITEWALIGTTTSGEEIDILVDKIYFSKTTQSYFEYFSRNAFVSGASGAYWQTDVSYADNDSINFEDELYDVLYYEMCVLTNQSAKFGNIDSQAISVFNTQRIEAWRSYWAENPSGQAPMTYSKSPEIDISQDIDFGVSSSDIDSVM